MDTLLQELHTGLQESPAWIQILWQAYAYTMLCWAIDSVEREHFFKESLTDSIEFVDPEFTKFPYQIVFEPIHDRWATTFMDLNPSKTQLEEEAELWCKIIQETVDPSLEIFSTLYDGQELTEETWNTLYDAMAFRLPHPQPQTPRQTVKGLHKTLRSHGRRAITPIRRRKGLRGLTARVVNKK